MRPSGRAPNEMRPVLLEPGFAKYAEGSCLVRFGDTHVLCTASLDERVPPFLKGQGRGWVTAEYGMLPRSTHERSGREAARGKQGGRTQEIQRLIGRSLRAVTRLEAIGERQIRLDCDVLQADGGTRTAAITGSWVALHLAFQWMREKGLIEAMPLEEEVAAVSCGIYRDLAVVLLVLHQMADGDAAVLEQRLQPITAPGNAWRYSALELAAALAERQGQRARAVELLKQLADDLDVPDGIRARAAETLKALGA